MNSLSSSPVLDERKLDFPFALGGSFGVFNRKLHGNALIGDRQRGCPYFFLASVFLMFSGRSAWGFQPLGCFLDSRITT